MLTIHNLHVQYDNKNEILKALNLSMEVGKTHGFVGLNGAGKTTLLNTLYSFVQPTKGWITFLDKPLQRRDIAYLEAENFFYTYMTGREYLELFPTGPSGFSLINWQELFSLPLDEITENYSTGMRKRLALLAVLKLDKPIIILDEPFNGLDLEGAHLLTLILSRLHERGKTILITSHIYEILTTSCHWIHYLVNGNIDQSFSQPEFPILKEKLQRTVEQNSLLQIQGLIADSK